jgi:hypothetical protein
MGTFTLSIRTETPIDHYPDPQRYVVEWEGDIVHHPHDGGEAEKVGEFSCSRVYVEQAAEEGEDVFDLCDAWSQELHHASVVLFSLKTRLPRQWLVDRFGTDTADFLLLETLTLEPRWRGLKIGLVVLRRLIDLFAPRFGMVVCQPFAFGAKDEKGWREGTVKLRKYVRALGFQRLRKSPFYGLCTSHVIPTAEQVLRGGK